MPSKGPSKGSPQDGGAQAVSMCIHEDPRIRLRAEAYRDDASLRHICDVNGIAEDAFIKKADTVDTLEIFMTIPVSLSCLHDFTGLRTLRVLKQPDVRLLSGLEDAKKLEGLWVCECSLESTSNLDKCIRLERLFLASNRITHLDGISTLTNLQQLWLNDNKLTSLSGLEALTGLTELWAARNHIQRVGSSLARCTNLTSLNLSDNRIACFREVLNLRSLEKLRSLALMDPHFGINPVTNLCNYQTLVIFHLTQLTQLDMRGVNDKSKHMAQSIFLKKRMYYNMRIRTLKRNAGNLILLAEGYLKAKTTAMLEAFRDVMRQIKDCEYALEELRSGRGGGAEPACPGVVASPAPSSHASAPQTAPASAAGGPGVQGGRQGKGAQHAGAAMAVDAAEASSCAALLQLEDRRRTLGKVAGIIEHRLGTMDLSLDVARDAVHHVTTRMVKHLMMEFNTGGNIRLEEGSEKEAWYNNFRHFVHSSFHAADFEPYGLVEIDVNRIVRLHNRLLRQRFDTRVKEVVRAAEQQQQQEQQQQPQPQPPQQGSGQPQTAADGSGAGNKSRLKPATAVEYLFLRIAEPMIDNVEEYVSRIAEEGFPTDDTLGPGIRLSTTVFDADQSRLRAKSRELRAGVRDVTDSGLIGRLLVVKIYRGRCLEIEMREEDFARKYGASGISAATFAGYQCLSIRFTDRPGPRQWYMLDPTLVVPEFIVDLDYVRRHDRDALLLSGPGASGITSTQATVEERLQCLIRDAGPEQDRSLLKVAPDQVMDLRPFSLPILRFAAKVTLLLNSYQRLHLSEQQQQQQQQQKDSLASSLRRGVVERLSIITEPELFRLTRASQLSSITYLNLHNQSLTHIENLSNCSGLRKLVLSYNSLTRMEGLSSLQQLESLDLSFNSIKKLEVACGLPCLQVLDLQHNAIERLDDPDGLHSYLPSLTDLTMRHNPVSRSRKSRLHLLRAFPGLETLDGTKVTERERTDMAEHSRFLSLEQIRKFALRSRPTPHLFEALPSLATDLDVWKRAMDQDSVASVAPLVSVPPAATTHGPPTCEKEAAGAKWLDSIEELHVDNEGIERLQHLDKLPLLRRASFAHNDLCSMEGLQSCTALEELSLEDNHITGIEHLDRCTRLKRLDLGTNALSSVYNLHSLQMLTQLSLENNEISCLSGLEHLSSLMELYLANNQVARTSELDTLRNISRLIILDLSGNPICQTNHYRTYTVYRLRWLKVLDGKPVTSREMGDSHKIFEGKLTYDALLEKVRPASFEDVQELNLSGCRLKDVDVLGGGDLENLRELVLDNNLLTNFQWVKGLTSLTTLSMARNRIEALAGPGQPRHTSGKDNLLVQSGALPSLEVLQLAHNRVVDLRDLELYHFPNLAIFHANNNEITQVNGLHHCTLLRELVLDHNKIRQLEPMSFCGLTSLREVRMENNGLRSLAHFTRLSALQLLHLANNRIGEFTELERLCESELRHPLDINLTGNPICRKPRYRNFIIANFPSLQVFDGRSVTDDEKERTLGVAQEQGLIKRYFTDIRMAEIPGVGSMQNKVTVKVTSVNMAESMRFNALQDVPFAVADSASTLIANRQTNVANPPGSMNHLPANARKLERTSSDAASSAQFLRARKGNQDMGPSRLR